MQIVLFSKTTVALDDNPNAYVWLHYEWNDSLKKTSKTENRIFIFFYRVRALEIQRNEMKPISVSWFSLFWNRCSHSLYNVRIGNRNMPLEFFFCCLTINSIEFGFCFLVIAMAACSVRFGKIQRGERMKEKKSDAKMNRLADKTAHMCSTAVCWRRKFRSWFFDLLWPNATPFSTVIL